MITWLGLIRWAYPKLFFIGLIEVIYQATIASGVKGFFISLLLSILGMLIFFIVINIIIGMENALGLGMHIEYRNGTQIIWSICLIIVGILIGYAIYFGIYQILGYLLLD